MQRAYITALCDLASEDSRVLSLLADSGTGYDELFRRYYPDQMLDFGIAEENMVAAAAGLALCGKIPFVYTAGAFLAYRSFEFIRDDVCFQRANVKIVGMGAGLSWSTLGVTHHTTEDLGTLRSLPGLTIFSPSCPREVGECVRAAYETDGPVYIKIGMNNEPDVFEQKEPGPFVTGKSRILKEGADTCILTSGPVAADALEAARLLEKEGTDCAVIGFPTIKPLDEEQIIACCGRYKDIFTVEEHNIIGGLGSAAAEIIAEQGGPARLHRIGLEDRFACGFGTHAQVRKANGLDAGSLAERIGKAWREKHTLH